MRNWVKASRSAAQRTGGDDINAGSPRGGGEVSQKFIFKFHPSTAATATCRTAPTMYVCVCVHFLVFILLGFILKQSSGDRSVYSVLALYLHAAFYKLPARLIHLLHLPPGNKPLEQTRLQLHMPARDDMPFACARLCVHGSV